MKQAVAFGVIWLFCTSAFAIAPVVLSGPSPAISSHYTVNTSNTVIYTVKNNVPKSFPLSVSGISNGIKRTTVTGDCGNTLPAGPSTCNIGLNINPANGQIGSTINQTLQIDYQGRTPLKSSISFSVSGIFAYVTPDLFSESIDQFSLDGQGFLSSSYTVATETTPPQSFGQMTFATVNGVQYAYILDSLGAVYWCGIQENGSFSNCMSTSSTPGLGSWSPRGISFATFDDQYAYVVDANSGNIFQFFLDSTGNFSQYILYGSLGVNAPNNIDFATDANGEQHSYIADASGNVFLCAMQSNGTFLSSCSPTPSSGAPSSWVPYSVAFNTVNGIQYAYVADNGAGIGMGNIYRCTLNANGSFQNSSCTTTPATGAPLWNPYYIAIKTVNAKTYAYVVDQIAFNPGNIYRCLIDQNGLLTDCELTPVNPPTNWQPTGIAFR
jgi:hypothetical protein